MKQESKDFSWKKLYHYLFVWIFSKRADLPNVAMNQFMSQTTTIPTTPVELAG
jgi:hypothetical protein